MMKVFTHVFAIYDIYRTSALGIQAATNELNFDTQIPILIFLDLQQIRTMLLHRLDKVSHCRQVIGIESEEFTWDFEVFPYTSSDGDALENCELRFGYRMDQVNRYNNSLLRANSSQENQISWKH